MRSRTGLQSLCVGTALFLLCLFQSNGIARSFRTSMLPNGNAFSCTTCHNFPGGPRNAFGLDMEKLVTRGGQEIFWSVALAALDSDGDGVTNGVELGDPAGTWKSGNVDPGDPAKITNPGDAKSFNIEQPSAVSGWTKYE